jgi:hypothetical protein
MQSKPAALTKSIRRVPIKRVIAGLDPAIHLPSQVASLKGMDARVIPDQVEDRRPRMTSIPDTGRNLHVRQ